MKSKMKLTKSKTEGRCPMKTKMKTIGLAMACAIAASTASADASRWLGEIDDSWWNESNWYYSLDENENIVETHFNSEINGNPEKYGWGTPIESHTTINLGGNDRPITTSGNVTVSYYGRIIKPGTWERSYDGGPIIFTNGTISVGGNVNIANDSKDPHDDTALDEAPPAVLKLQDVTLTCTAISILYGWRNEGSHGNGRLTVEDGALVSAEDMKMGVVDSNLEDASTAEFIMNGGEATFSAFTCSAKSYVAGVNGSTFVPSWMKVEIGEGGIVIDSNGHDITFAATNVAGAVGVTTDGGLTKKGNGTLTVVQDAQVWNGPTRVLGGTLDLNGGTITGPLVLGGNGKIVNATIATTDITIQSNYVFDTTMWDIIDTARVTISGAVSIASPLNSILNSAAAWYDPSDTSVGNLTTNENGGVTAIKNKSATGDSMDADFVAVAKIENEEVVFDPPTTTTINNLTAIAFTNTPGFVSHNAASFAEPQGKSVFAVAQFNAWWQTVYPIEWGGNWEGDWNGNFGMYIKWESEDSRVASGYYRILSGSEKPVVADQSLSIEIAEQGSPYVMSLRGTKAVVENTSNIFARVTSISNGKIVDGSKSASGPLSFDKDNEGSSPHVAYGWSYAKGQWGGYSNNGAVGEALAFARCLSDEEAEVVQTYLAHKWVSSSIPATWPLTVGTLTLDGDVDFNGANVTIGDLSGNGSITNAASLKVTGTITAKADSTIRVAGDIDLTGANFAVDASLAESLAYNQSVTLLASTGTITGFGSPVVLTVDTRKFKVRKSNGAITVTRIPPGLAIMFK